MTLSSGSSGDTKFGEVRTSSEFGGVRGTRDFEFGEFGGHGRVRGTRDLVRGTRDLIQIPEFAEFGSSGDT